jgi:hypothetical protein
LDVSPLNFGGAKSTAVFLLPYPHQVQWQSPWGARWSRRGADFLLQVRCAVYNGRLGSGFGQRFIQPTINTRKLPQAAIAA